jgi:hypothetical protein
VRGLTFEQLLLLLLLVGIPLVRALARRIRGLSQPPGAAAAEPDSSLQLEQLPVVTAALEPRTVSTPTATSATHARMATPRPAALPSPSPVRRSAVARARSLLRQGESGMRSAFVLKTILEPPRSLEEMEPSP